MKQNWTQSEVTWFLITVNWKIILKILCESLKNLKFDVIYWQKLKISDIRFEIEVFFFQLKKELRSCYFVLKCYKPFTTSILI